ncbi:MAG: Fe-S cluster assembly scaffold protein NifU [Firmicutes bacterium]|nr:Fe-S cluster assembly scaffold protein NifU [Bacillota bacterium]
MEYTDKVMDHFQNPRNMGKIDNPSAVGEVGNATCGDIMRIYLDIEEDVIKDVKFQTYGCGAAIATTSIMTELVKGKKLEDALKVTNANVAEELGGLPPVKMHCSNLAADALQAAIEDYKNKNQE